MGNIYLKGLKTVVGLVLRNPGKISLSASESQKQPPIKEEISATIAKEATSLGTQLQTAARQVSLPTREEVTHELKLRLAMELYKAEADLTAKLKIAGKPCDCLLVRHPLKLMGLADEIITKDPDNPIYNEIIQWVKDVSPKTTPEAILSGLYDNEYPKMGDQAADFAKRVAESMGITPLIKVPPAISLEEAKKIAAEEAEKEVERKWQSQEKK